MEQYCALGSKVLASRHSKTDPAINDGLIVEAAHMDGMAIGGSVSWFDSSDRPSSSELCCYIPSPEAGNGAGFGRIENRVGLSR